MVAVDQGREDIVKMLVDKGATLQFSDQVCHEL